MCGRFVFTPGGKATFTTRFDIENDVEVEERYNIAPGAMVPVVTRQSPNQAVLMRWGLIPFWAKDPRIGYALINARAETVAQKPAFRKPLRIQRCIVPTNGFYEWRKGPDGSEPFFIHRKDGTLMGFAGLYDVWKDAEGHPIRSFTIITTTPNAVVAPIHDRMPAILREDQEDRWLDPKTQDPAMLLPLLSPYEGKTLEAYSVSKAVNKASIDEPSLIRKSQASPKASS
jgi:putative SOS response-associated peptidase YedK